ncbi:MAG TPA: hypothetical protein VFK05_33550 [Polyangiaceae bacterium]|nr:hypothetical protein [Polyangiaceae bacterium]
MKSQIVFFHRITWLSLLLVNVSSACSNEGSSSGTGGNPGTAGVAAVAGHSGAHANGGNAQGGASAGGAASGVAGSSGMSFMSGAGGGSSAAAGSSTSGASGSVAIAGSSSGGRGGSGGTAGGSNSAGAGGVAGSSNSGGASGRAGAGGSAGGGGTGPTMSATQAIFNQRCTNCHDASKTGLTDYPGLPLTSDAAYQALVSHPADQTCGGTRVVPYDSANSYLFRKVSDATPCSGLRMPHKPEVGPMTPLSATEIETIRAWIDGGAHP